MIVFCKSTKARGCVVSLLCFALLNNKNKNKNTDRVPLTLSELSLPTVVLVMKKRRGRPSLLTNSFSDPKDSWLICYRRLCRSCASLKRKDNIRPYLVRSVLYYIYQLNRETSFQLTLCTYNVPEMTFKVNKHSWVFSRNHLTTTNVAALSCNFNTRNHIQTSYNPWRKHRRIPETCW